MALLVDFDLKHNGFGVDLDNCIRRATYSNHIVLPELLRRDSELGVLERLQREILHDMASCGVQGPHFIHFFALAMHVDRGPRKYLSGGRTFGMTLKSSSFSSEGSG